MLENSFRYERVPAPTDYLQSLSDLLQWTPQKIEEVQEKAIACATKLGVLDHFCNKFRNTDNAVVGEFDTESIHLIIALAAFRESLA